MECKHALDEGGDLGKADEAAQRVGPGHGRKEGWPRGRPGPDRQLHPRRPHRRAGRAQLRDGLRRAHGRLQARSRARSPCRSRRPTRRRISAQPKERSHRRRRAAARSALYSRREQDRSRSWSTRRSPRCARTSSIRRFCPIRARRSAPSQRWTVSSAFVAYLLKLSGEALQGGATYGIDFGTLESVARQVAAVMARGVEVGMVIGGGNIWRGEPAAERGMDRATADYMGMLATVMNGAGAAVGDGAHRAAHAGADRGHDDRGRRAVHSPPRDPPLRKGPRGDLRRGHRQSRTSPRTRPPRCARSRSEPTCC